LLLKILAKKYDVPELANLGDFYSVERHVGSSSGIKRGFSFLLHEAKKELNTKNCVQLPTLTPPFGPDLHYYRQDIDAYLLSVAVQYGAELKQHTTISNINNFDNKIDVHTNNGVFKTKFLIDGSGFNSIMASFQNLRHEDPIYETNTRSIFTHMVNVKPYDQVISKKEHNLNYPIAQTTLHHLFKGGWMWVIPFDNHKFSSSNLCSVGLTLDKTIYPDNDLSAEEEFNSFLNLYPDIKKQFIDSKPFREWVKTKRIQYSSKKFVGKNWALLPHSAGFVDPLFSAGLTQTCYGVDALADVLINNNEKDRAAELGNYETLIQRSLNLQDKMVVNAYRSFSTGFPTWNAWFRIWCLGSILGGASLLRILCRYEETKDIKYLNQINDENFNTAFSLQLPEILKLFNESEQLIINAYENNECPVKVSEKIFEKLKNCTVAPKYLKLWMPENINVTDFTLLTAWKLPISFQFNYDGKPEYRNIYADYKLLTIIKSTVKFYFKYRNNFVSTKKEILKDLILRWNNYWKTGENRTKVKNVS